MSDVRNKQIGSSRDVLADGSSEDQVADAPELTKREAILFLHAEENFPNGRGFSEENIAKSLGWSIEKVREAREVCKAHGLAVGRPYMPDLDFEDSPEDLLSPEEQDAARLSRVPRDQWLALGEELAVLRALEAGCDSGFTQDQAEAALEWGRQARLRSLILDLVLDGYAAVHIDPDGEGDVSFSALDGNGNRVCKDCAESEEGEESCAGLQERDEGNVRHSLPDQELFTVR